MPDEELQRCREELRKAKEQLANCRQELEANRTTFAQPTDVSSPFDRARQHALVTDFFECTSNPVEAGLQQV